MDKVDFVLVGSEAVVESGGLGRSFHFLHVTVFLVLTPNHVFVSECRR
jgi:hypothetical protein